MATTALIAERQTRTETRSPLALWHLLSLDAPAVAALWTMYGARCFAVSLPWSAPAALAIAVWILYAADRLADAARGSELRERHYFHQRHRHAFLCVIAGALPLLAVLLTLMPHTLRLAWMLQALPLAAYVAAVHALRVRHVPKEYLVGIFFAATCFMPALLLGFTLAGVVAMLLFGTLCWLNCAALARWESAPRAGLDRGTAWASKYLRTACLTLAAIAALMLVPLHTRAVAFSVVLSCVALCMLDETQARMQPVHLRALADAALLTPLLTWPLLHLLQPVR